MRAIPKIDSGSGNFVEDVLVEDSEEIPENCIETPVPEGLRWPRWTGLEWEDADPKTDMEILEEAKAAKKSEVFRALISRAISHSGDTDVNSAEDLVLLVIPTMYQKLAQTQQLLGREGGQTRAADALAASVPATDLDAMMMEFAAYYETKAQIEAAKTPEAVEEVEW